MTAVKTDELMNHRLSVADEVSTTIHRDRLYNIVIWFS